MATSAFRSTTKRSQVGPAGDAVPATPLKGRSSGFSDTNSKYFSDSSSMSDARYGEGEGKARASSRRFSVDSETDADGPSKRYQRSRRRDGSESDGSSYRSLRRSSSQSDYSKHRTRRGTLFSDREASGDEMQVEERTIRAVHAQMKQIRNKNPTEELDMIGLYDAMRAEVRQAIADLKQEIRQSVSGTIDVGKRYAERLEESEQRASQLWSELAEEEQRCAELSNIMKELLPDDRVRVVKRASRTRRYGSQTQSVSQSLDEDARKYFDECVSVSRLECEPDMSERSSVVSTESVKLSSSEPLSAPTRAQRTKEDKMEADRDRASQPAITASHQQRGSKLIVAHPGSTEEQKATSSAPLKQKPSTTGLNGSSAPRETRSSKISQSQCVEVQDEPKNQRTRRTPVNVDGIAMPWLEWETGSSDSSRRSRRQDKLPNSASSTDSDALTRSHNKPTRSRCGSSNSSSSSAQLTSSSSNSNNSSSSEYLSEIEFLPHRFRYVNRIVSGRMHLCMEAL